VKNQSLRQFSDGLKEVAAKQGATFVDQFDPYMAIMLRERAANRLLSSAAATPFTPVPPATPSWHGPS